MIVWNGLDLLLVSCLGIGIGIYGLCLAACSAWEWFENWRKKR